MKYKNKTNEECMEHDFKDIVGMRDVLIQVAYAVMTGDSIIEMCGPPGSGKSMIARRIPGLMEPVENKWSQHIRSDEETVRPFRCPHHTISEVGMIGRDGRPGELDLAEGGVLYLDEFPEFRRSVIDALAANLPGRNVKVVIGTFTCPCGFYGFEGIKKCVCSENNINRYQDRAGELTKILRGGYRRELAPITTIDVPMVPYADLRGPAQEDRSRISTEELVNLVRKSAMVQSKRSRNMKRKVKDIDLDINKWEMLCDDLAHTPQELFVRAQELNKVADQHLCDEHASVAEYVFARANGASCRLQGDIDKAIGYETLADKIAMCLRPTGDHASVWAYLDMAREAGLSILGD